MKYRQFYIGKLPNEQWSNVFIYCLNLSNKFKIHFHEDISGYEKEFYLELETVQKLDIKPWKGCEHFIEIRGILDEKTKAIFKKYLYQSLKDNGKEIWDYQFLSDFREVLYVGDFTDRLVIFSEKELKEIKQQEVCFGEWDKCDDVCPEMLDERKKIY